MSAKVGEGGDSWRCRAGRESQLPWEHESPGTHVEGTAGGRQNEKPRVEGDGAAHLTRMT